MANVNISHVQLVNTFDEWRAATNDLIEDRNILRNANYVKDNGTFTIFNTVYTSPLLTIGSGGQGNVFISNVMNATTVNANSLFVNRDATITGNLTVLGNTTTLSTETLTVEDADIVVLSNVAGVPSLNAGLTVNRGTSTNTFLRWNEVTDKWGWSDDGTIMYNFSTSLDAYLQANNARDQANTARDTANDAYLQANTARTTANDAYLQANTARDQANTARTTANDAYGQANTATTIAQNAYGQANTARDTANSAYGQANTATTNAGNAYNQANTATTNAGNAYNQANTSLTVGQNAYGQANAARDQANIARTQANNAYEKANDSLSVTYGGTITGDVIVTGSLTVQGSQTILNTEVLTTEDADILLLSNVTGSPILNAGLTVNRGTSACTFLRWTESVDKWGWSDDGSTVYYFNDLRTTFGGTLKSYKDFVSEDTNVSGSKTIDLSVSNWFKLTLTGSTGNRQITFNNAPASGTGFTVTLIILQDGTGSKTPTWANTIYWAGGQIPPATTAASARDLWTFTTYDGGSTFLGTLAVKDAK